MSADPKTDTGGDRVRGDRVEGSLTSGGSIPGRSDDDRTFGGSEPADSSSAGDQPAPTHDQNNGVANGSGAD